MPTRSKNNWFRWIFANVLLALAMSASADTPPPILADILLKNANFYSARKISDMRKEGEFQSVIGALPDGSTQLWLPVETLRVEMKAGGLSVSELAAYYRKKFAEKGGRLLNKGLQSDTALYNGLFVFAMPDGNREQIVALWINGWKAYQHFFFLVPAKDETKPAVVSAAKLQETIKTSGSASLYLNFETNRSEIRPADFDQLDQAALLMKSEPLLKLSIEGHTDNVGGRDKNQRLSEARAGSVMEALTKRGVKADRLTTVGKGDSKPLASNATPDGREKNRRVELVKQ